MNKLPVVIMYTLRQKNQSYTSGKRYCQKKADFLAPFDFRFIPFASVSKI